MAAKMKIRINTKKYNVLHISPRHGEPFTLSLEGGLPLAEIDSYLLDDMEAEEPSLTRKILKRIESQNKKGFFKGQFKIQEVKVYFEQKIYYNIQLIVRRQVECAFNLDGLARDGTLLPFDDSDFITLKLLEADDAKSFKEMSCKIRQKLKKLPS